MVQHRRIASFDAFRIVDLIAPRPLLLLAGREAVTSWMSVEAFQNASDPKELHWKEQYVSPAVARLTHFFEVHLVETN